MLWASDMRCLAGERGQCILSTPPKILFCDLRLDPGESKSCELCLPPPRVGQRGDEGGWPPQSCRRAAGGADSRTRLARCSFPAPEPPRALSQLAWLSGPLPLPPDSYCETLPVDGPPSFRGQAVKYVYKLTIGCQRVNSAIKLLRVPFRVMVLQGKRAPPRAPPGTPACRTSDFVPPSPQGSETTPSPRMRPWPPLTHSWRRKRAA